MSFQSSIKMLCGVSLVGALASPAVANDANELAKQLANPVASLISVPFQFNYDEGYGPDGNGSRYTINVQPVIPISISENWNLISRTIVPFMFQDGFSGDIDDSGYGDIVQSFFFSPKQPTRGGIIWGAGPVFLLPTGSDGYGADQFAMGVTAVALKQTGPWTFGFLGNPLWDVGGGGDATDISSTFAQPFVSYATANAWTFALNTEATYDWVNEETSLPINFTATKVTKLGSNLVSVGGGLRYWADSPTNGADGLAARLILTFLYPK